MRARTTNRRRGGEVDLERAVKGSVRPRNIAWQDDDDNDDDDGATSRRSSDISALKTGLLRMLKPSSVRRPNVRADIMHEPIVSRVCA